MEATPYVVYLTSTPKNLAIDPACQSDLFYRYKMRQLTVQTIGNGKMIRTSFTNLDDVAKDLKVPPSYIPHYLGKAIGAQAKYDQNKPAMQRGSISGEHGTKELSNLLVRFIREFVLCGKCKLPELDYIPKKNDLELRCHGCGWKGTLSTIVNMNEKFKRFVYTHPPPPRKDSKKPPRPGGPSRPAAPEASTNGKGSKKPRNGGAKGDGEEEVVWLSDTTEKAMEERMETMVPDRLKSLVAVEGAAPEPEEPAKPSPAEILKAFITKSPAPSNPDIIAEVNRLATQERLDAKGCALLIFDALLSDLATLNDKIKPYKDVLVRCIGTDAVAQFVVLEAIEKKVSQQKDAKLKDEFLTKKAIFAFKAFYDEDVIDEETILSWYLPEGKSDQKLDPLRKALQPFCKWLEEAEEESDEDDDDDDDGDDSGEDVPAAKPATKPATTAAAKEKEAPVAEQELDEEIDAL